MSRLPTACDNDKLPEIKDQAAGFVSKMTTSKEASWSDVVDLAELLH